MYIIKRLKTYHAKYVLEHLARLDPQSVYNRFCVAANYDFLQRYVNQMNFNISGIYGVFDNSLNLIGVGECVVDGVNAEVAFSIELEHQGKGLGTRLMKRLKQFAKASFIKKLNMYCLRSNVKSVYLAKKFGINIKYEFGEVSAEISLPKTNSMTQQQYEMVEETCANIQFINKFVYNFWNDMNTSALKNSVSLVPH